MELELLAQYERELESLPTPKSLKCLARLREEYEMYGEVDEKDADTKTKISRSHAGVFQL